MKADFLSLGLPEALVSALKQRGITDPAPVQERMFAPVLEGKDVLCTARTGSGKTLAYLLPILTRMDYSAREVQAVVLAPTRELAVQVEREASGVAKAAGYDLRTALLIGGANKERQMKQLKEKPQLVVANPGRLLELYGAKKLKMSTVRTIVLDEADRLLGELAAEETAAVIKTTLRDRQLVMVSASMDNPDGAKAMMKEDALILTAERRKLPEGITHGYVVTDLRQKMQTLRKILAAENPRRAVIFVNNAEYLNVTVEKLNYHGHKAVGLYGGGRQDERRDALNAFREGRANLLVATDLAARGLDIPDLTHVIQLDVPEDMTQYQHRVGRCGRQGAEGRALMIMTPGQVRWVRAYEKAFQIKLTALEPSYGKLVPASPAKKAAAPKAAPKGEEKPKQKPTKKPMYKKEK